MIDIDPYWLAFGYIVLGGVLGVIIPYLFKVMDKEVKFSYSYFYALFIAMAITAAGLVPESISDFGGRMIMLLIMSGFGIQAATNLVTSKVRKGIVTKG